MNEGSPIGADLSREQDMIDLPKNWTKSERILGAAELCPEEYAHAWLPFDCNAFCFPHLQMYHIIWLRYAELRVDGSSSGNQSKLPLLSLSKLSVFRHESLQSNCCRMACTSS